MYSLNLVFVGSWYLCLIHLKAVKHANSSDGFWVAQNFQMSLRKSTFLCDMDSLVAVMTYLILKC